MADHLSTDRRREPGVAVVTGGNRGIGRAIVLKLAASGWKVAMTYREHAEEAEAVVREACDLSGASRPNVWAQRLDVGSREAVRDFFKALDNRWGSAWALVNNAGTIGGQCSVLDIDPTRLERVFGANVFGTFYCISEAASRMARSRGGRGGVIVNISSAAARLGGLPLESHYAASKGAIDSLTIALARELAPEGIRINGLRPGLIATPIHEAHGGEATVSALAPHVPLGRVGAPEEVAEVVEFLLEARSSYMHGAIVDVSGGR